MKNDKKYFIIGIIAIIFVIAVPLVTYIINLDDNKENKNDITTTTTKKNDYNDLVITNETLLQDCVNSTCKEIKIGNIKLQVKNYKLYLNGEVLFPESGSMEYDDQLYYEIKYMDDDNLFFNVTFAGEYSHQYIYGKDGKESIDIRSLSNF